jgi:hypothetical protein
MSELVERLDRTEGAIRDKARRLGLRRLGGKCEICGAEVKRLEVHHWTYKSPYSEWERVNVCRECHLLADAFRKLCEAELSKLLMVWKVMPEPLKDRFDAVVSGCYRRSVVDGEGKEFK